MFTFSQSTGLLAKNGIVLDRGYSGHGAGVNNPQMQNVRMVGPAPLGMYTIGQPQEHPLLGPLAMPLTPDPDQEMFDRSGFFIHGDNAKLNRSASEGCLIFQRSTRLVIANAIELGDNRLQIIP